MQYYSLNNQSPSVDFKTAAILGQAPDKGLYFPQYIPQIDNDLLKNINSLSDHEIAYRVIKPYIGNSIPDIELQRIVAETISFPIPLVEISAGISSLELFHGPTMAFKDVGALFMSRCLGYFSGERSEKVIVLVATSGDTGGAVANGFYNVPGVDVVILYPKGKVSVLQEKQMTTLGGNIHALEVKGNFDDCQALVKRVFNHAELTQKLFLTSANSINVARWLPQQFYYFFAWKQWADKQRPPVISVPSGNFGNICAGLLAYKSGLPVQHFIAACNANDIVPKYLETQQYKPRRATTTISNAMDIGDPSNFVRILELFRRNFNELKATMGSVSISDKLTKETIQNVYKQYGYILDPHGAVAYTALQQYLLQYSQYKGFIIETAHPVKFPESMHSIIGNVLEDAAVFTGEKRTVVIEPDFETLKKILLSLK